MEPKKTNVRPKDPNWKDLLKPDFIKTRANHKYIISTIELENIFFTLIVWQFKAQ